jgi:hypothetical protein
MLGTPGCCVGAQSCSHPAVGDLVTRLKQSAKPVCIQAFIMETTVETLDMPVLHRLTWLNVIHRDLPL